MACFGQIHSENISEKWIKRPAFLKINSIAAAHADFSLRIPVFGNKNLYKNHIYIFTIWKTIKAAVTGNKGRFTK